MEQPKGFTSSGKKDLACKSLYRLNQWPMKYKKFDAFIVENWSSKFTFDHCVFVQKFFDSDFVILSLYVDGMLIVGHDSWCCQI